MSRKLLVSGSRSDSDAHDASVWNGFGEKRTAGGTEFTVVETQRRDSLVQHQTSAQLFASTVFEPINILMLFKFSCQYSTFTHDPIAMSIP